MEAKNIKREKQKHINTKCFCCLNVISIKPALTQKAHVIEAKALLRSDKVWWSGASFCSKRNTSGFGTHRKSKDDETSVADTRS